MERKLILSGSIFMVIAVVLGALGAHAFKEVLGPDQINSFETAVRYQVYHAIALILFATLNMYSRKTKNILFYGFVSGILLFSGSIYLLVLAPLIDYNLSFMGPVTPLGGLMLILTWVFIIVKTLSYKAQNN